MPIFGLTNFEILLTSFLSGIFSFHRMPHQPHIMLEMMTKTVILKDRQESFEINDLRLRNRYPHFSAITKSSFPTPCIPIHANLLWLMHIGLCVFPAPLHLLLLLSDSWGSNTDKWELQLATTPLTYSPFPPFPLSLNVWLFRLFSLLENPTKNRPCSSGSFVFLYFSTDLKTAFVIAIVNCY